MGAILCGCLLLAASLCASDVGGSTQKPSSPSQAKKKPGTHLSTAKASAHRKRISAGKRSRKSKSRRNRGQQVIDSARAREIQQALIQQHYLDGEPSGRWDSSTEEALRKYQADQGWQTKTVPDSRALIKLGLGPSKDGLLNPESAMRTGPDSADPKQPESSVRGKDENKPQSQ